jgi:two-component system cell cycle response regulator
VEQLAKPDGADGAPEAAESPEKRSDPRHRVLYGGKLVEATGAFSTDCAIRELSKDGARLRMSAPVPMGDDVYLIELRSGEAHLVHVVWRQGADLGVAFRRSVDLHDDETRDRTTKRLRRLWLDAGIH